MKTYKITLVKSLNGRFKKHITVQPDNEMTRGKINQISYLIRVEEMN